MTKWFPNYVVLADIKGKGRYRVSHVEMHVSGSGPLNPDFHIGKHFKSAVFGVHIFFQMEHIVFIAMVTDDNRLQASTSDVIIPENIE